MALIETRDAGVIATRLDELLAADPVRNTVLGTVREDLGAAWAVLDDGAAAVRSAVRYPVALSTGWTEPGLRALAPFVATQPALALGGQLAAVDVLTAALGRTPTHRLGQRLFRLDELVPPRGVEGSAVRANPRHQSLITEWLRGFAHDAHSAEFDPAEYAEQALAGGGVWLWLDAAGTPVSTAFRRAAIAGSARIGPVYTPPAHRAHGYGSAVTAATTADVLADGAIPVLFTELANPTSNKIYAALGYEPVEDRVLVRF